MKQPQLQPFPRRGAFTLVELLVVIGIIGVLISILLPALSKARRNANAAVCLSNLSQMALGLQMYAGDNHQVFPPYYYHGIWMITIAPYVAPGQINPYLPPSNLASTLPLPPTSVQQQLGAMNTITTPKVWFCPEAPLSSAIGTVGSSAIPWGPGTYPNMYYLAASYGFNSFCYNTLYSDTDSGMSDAIYYSGVTTHGVSQANAVNYFVNSKNPVGASNTPVFMDSVWLDGAVNDFSTTWINPPPTTSQEMISGSLTTGISRICIVRHGPGINVAFLDGHAVRVQLGDLWGLQWSPMSARLPVPSPGIPNLP
jgi:prepilin-type N-terminal cleavage/methylation domain-containing protein/prepilin-type processing-associated H-X9-DG protein